MRKPLGEVNSLEINGILRKPVKATILIVDDEKQIRKMLMQLLEGEGYRCYAAENAESAIHFLGEHSVDLVISDVKMPGKSGIQLLKEIRNAYPAIATLMMTGYSDPLIADTAIALGA